jgi:hypothetical protein
MTSIKELDRLEEWNNWYYTRLQESVNKIVSTIQKEKSPDEE